MAHVQTFIQSAWQHLSANRPKQAMDFVKKAHAISPNLADVSHLLGLLASLDGKPEIALPLLQKAIDTGGKTPQRLIHIAEALLKAGYPEAALAPLNDAIDEFGTSAELLGLKSTIEISLEQWVNAAASVQAAIEQNYNVMAWALNLSFAQLMQGQMAEGFKNATFRPENLKTGCFCPTFMFSKPSNIWLKGEHSLDALFYLRYVAPLVKQGWQFHIEADRKLITLLQNTQLFLSVKEKQNYPKNEVCISIYDLPLVALQCGINEIPPPLALVPDSKLVEKYQKELAKIGPAPYIAVSWRESANAYSQNCAVTSSNRSLDPKLFASSIANINGTIINLQRSPIVDEVNDFNKALGRKSVDYSALNNNLPAMLAFLSLVDEYITVPNVNLYLREGLGKQSHVFVNRPLQDWRWQSEGVKTSWHPNTQVYYQQKDKNWQDSLSLLVDRLTNKMQQKTPTTQPKQENLKNNLQELQITADKHLELINQGWAALTQNINEAIAKAKAVLDVNPQHPRALHLLGWAAIQDLKFDLGAGLLLQATTIEPNNGNIWRDYIRANVILGKFDEALKIGEECLAIPTLWARGVVHYAIGIAYSSLDEDVKALEHFEKCTKLLPNHLDAPSTAGLTCMRLGDGYAMKGFKLNTSRVEARGQSNYHVWTCPVLRGDIKGLKVLIVRSMGIGDELSYLRYLPYLIEAGAIVTYWSGLKLAPLLSRLSYPLTVIPETEPMPDTKAFDIAFIKNELPIAVEHLGAPDVADPLPLVVHPEKLEYWRQWLAQQGPEPYIGITWSAGVAGKVKDAFSYSRLSKKIEPADFAKALSGINATWISLTRNITKSEHQSFEQLLGKQVIDLAGLTDDIDDLLCVQYLLDENVGVSNTNMHLRASLGLGSKVLVSLSSRDWRWGVFGTQSTWFKQSKVYRETKQEGWQVSLSELRTDLIQKYGLSEAKNKKLHNLLDVESRQTIDLNSTKSPKKSKKIIWVTAGEIKRGEQGYFSELESAQERVINVAKLLQAQGWQSEFLMESVSELMGGWHDKLPVKDDIVVFSKVFTEHAITLMQDARARGAKVILDVFNDFQAQPKRTLHQQRLMEHSDYIVSTPSLKNKWISKGQEIQFYFPNVKDDMADTEKTTVLNNWHKLLNTKVGVRNQELANTVTPSFNSDALLNKKNHSKRVLVGMMYSGEQEYEQAKQALQNQTHKSFELFEVKDLPNKLAHDTLYASFMQHASEYDYFLKLDADMVFTHESVLKQMVEAINIEGVSNLFAWVKDCPSGLMIPGIQMFRSDTKWEGSSEQLNVDYLPKTFGESRIELNQNWIQHMPAPSEQQLFRYGVHKALKSIQPDRQEKNLKKGILHLTILNGIARNVVNNPNLWFSLIGASLVYQKAFDTIEYNGEQTKKYFDILKNKPEKLKVIKDMAETFWSNEVQVNYWWLDNFDKFSL